MVTWFTADAHFDHFNIIRYCGRPFADEAEMNLSIIERHNYVVAAQDTVWMLGDVSLSVGALHWVGELSGHKILVPGNHDRCWAGRGPKATKAQQMYFDAGFEQIVDHPDPLLIAGRQVLLDHFPYRNTDPTQPVADSRSLERHVGHRPVDEGSWLLHGHVHEKWQQKGRMINVGVDAWGGAPVSLETLARIIGAEPADVAPPPWT